MRELQGDGVLLRIAVDTTPPPLKRIPYTVLYQVNHGQDIYVDRRRARRRHRARWNRLGRRVRQALQQAALRVRSGQRLLGDHWTGSVRLRAATGAERARHHPSSLHGHGNADPQGQRPARDPGTLRAIVLILLQLHNRRADDVAAAVVDHNLHVARRCANGHVRLVRNPCAGNARRPPASSRAAPCSTTDR